jgi:DNA polymerase elongation subunit (family B)
LEKVKIEEDKVEEEMKSANSGRQDLVRRLNTDRQERLQQMSKSLILKVYKENTSDAFVLTILDKAEETVNTLRQKIKEHFQIN